jgi:AraC family transcriptional regulator
VAEVEYAPGFEMGLHDHPQPYLTVVLDGEYMERTEGASRTCRAGGVVFRPAGEPHAMRVPPGGARCLRVRFAPFWLERVAAGARVPICSLGVAPGPAGWLGARMHLELHSGGEASRGEIELAALSLITEVLRRTGPADRVAPSWLGRVVERIHAEFRGPLTLAALAGPEAVHPAHLARAFRRSQGVTVAAYVRRLRLEHAMRELRATPRSLAAIAHAAGFADQSHLTRALKAATGVTPRVFRRRTRSR